MNALTKHALDFAGRAIVGMTFFYWGARKLVDVLGLGAPELGGWTGYMERAGVPGALLPVVIATEIGGGLLLLIGYQTRIAALALAGFCVLANYFFHMGFHLPPPVGNFSWVVFIKNFAVAGGLLVIASHGPNAWSLDALRAPSK